MAHSRRSDLPWHESNPKVPTSDSPGVRQDITVDDVSDDVDSLTKRAGDDRISSPAVGGSRSVQNLDDLINSLDQFASMDSSSDSGQSPSSVDEYETDVIDDIASVSRETNTNVVEIGSHTDSINRSDDADVNKSSPHEPIVSSGSQSDSSINPNDDPDVSPLSGDVEEKEDITLLPDKTDHQTVAQANTDTSGKLTVHCENVSDDEINTVNGLESQSIFHSFKEDDVSLEHSTCSGYPQKESSDPPSSSSTNSNLHEYNCPTLDGRESNDNVTSIEDTIEPKPGDEKPLEPKIINKPHTDDTTDPYYGAQEVFEPPNKSHVASTSSLNASGLQSNQEIELDSSLGSSSIDYRYDGSTWEKSLSNQRNAVDNGSTEMSGGDLNIAKEFLNNSPDLSEINYSKPDMGSESSKSAQQDDLVREDPACSDRGHISKSHINDRMKRLRDTLECLKSKAVTGNTDKKHKDTPVVADIPYSLITGHDDNSTNTGKGLIPSNQFECVGKSNANSADDNFRPKQDMAKILQDINCLTKGDDCVLKTHGSISDSKLEESSSRLHTDKTESTESEQKEPCSEVSDGSRCNSLESLCSTEDIPGGPFDDHGALATKKETDGGTDDSIRFISNNDKHTNTSSSDSDEKTQKENDLKKKNIDGGKDRPNTGIGIVFSRLFENLPFLRQSGGGGFGKALISTSRIPNFPTSLSQSIDIDSNTGADCHALEIVPDGNHSDEKNSQERIAAADLEQDTSSNDDEMIPNNNNQSKNEITTTVNGVPKVSDGNVISKLFENLPFMRQNEGFVKSSSRPSSEHLTVSPSHSVKFYSVSDDHGKDRGLSLSPEERGLQELILFKGGLPQALQGAEGEETNTGFEVEDESGFDDLLNLLTDLTEHLQTVRSTSEFKATDEAAKSVQEIRSNLLENLHLLQTMCNGTVQSDLDSIDEEEDTIPLVNVSEGARRLADMNLDPQQPMIISRRSNDDDNLSLEFFVPGSKKTFRLHRRTFIAWVLKYSIFMFSFLFWFTSLSVMGFGGWMLATEPAIVIDDFTDVLLDPYALLCMVGGIVFLVAFFGCVGALRENICLLKIFHLAMTFVFVLEILVGAIVFLFFTLPEFRQAVKVGPEEVLRRAVINYFDDVGMQRWIDNLQKQFRCCGTSLTDDGYLDWQENAYFNCSSPSMYRCSVPLSCCIFEKGDFIDYMCGADIIRREEAYVRRYINTKGCMKSLGEWLADNTTIIAYITAAIIIPQILSVVSARYFISMLRKYTRDDKNKRPDVKEVEDPSCNSHTNSDEERGCVEETLKPQGPSAATNAKSTWRRLSNASKAIFQANVGNKLLSNRDGLEYPPSQQQNGL